MAGTPFDRLPKGSDQANDIMLDLPTPLSSFKESSSEHGLSDFSEDSKDSMLDTMTPPKVDKRSKANTQNKRQKQFTKEPLLKGEKLQQPSHPPKTKISLSDKLGDDMTQCLVSPKPQAETMNLFTLMTLPNTQSEKPVENKKALNDLLLNSFQSAPQNLTAAIAAQLMMTQLVTDPGSFPMLQGLPSLPIQNQTQRSKAAAKRGNRANINTFTLSDFTALSALESLVERFGRVSHMGIMDPSYNFFLNENRDAALYYKVQNKIAVVGGDPLCRSDQILNLLEEFRKFRRRHSWGIVFLGATDNFVQYAKTQKKWVTMRFGTERVINPLTNAVLQESESKRMIQQNKALIDLQRGGIGVRAYSPSKGSRGGKDTVLETQLASVYHTWREQRNQSGQTQTYMTVFDPFAIPSLMVYVYTIDLRAPEKGPNGFAALRKLGANNGYHLDPCCVTPDAPRGITDLLVFSAMSLLKKAGVAYMSLGFEPATDLSEINAMSRPLQSVTKSVYRRVFRKLAVSGKKAFHDKYRPDESLDSGLHLVFPDGIPGSNEMLACMHIANISVKQVCSTGVKKRLNIGKEKAEKAPPPVDQGDLTSATNSSSSNNSKIELSSAAESDKSTSGDDSTGSKKKIKN